MDELKFLTDLYTLPFKFGHTFSGTRILAGKELTMQKIDELKPLTSNQTSICPLTNVIPKGPAYVRTLMYWPKSLWEIRFEGTYTALVHAVPVRGTRHVTPDLSKGRKQEENDQSPRNVELNSERPSTGSSPLRRLHPPAMPLCFLNFLSVYSSEVNWECRGRGGRAYYFAIHRWQAETCISVVNAKLQ